MKHCLALCLALLLSLSCAACTGSTPPTSADNATSNATTATTKAAAANNASDAQKADNSAAPSNTPKADNASSSSSNEASNQNETSAAKNGATEPGPYKDGQYEASAVGYAGGLKVRVTIANGKIAKVEIVHHNEVGKQYYEAAIRDVPGIIVERQSVEGIDAVSGSTMTTKGILKATEKALRKAKK